MKRILIALLAMALCAGCGGGPTEGTIILPYPKPSDFSHFEVFVGLSSGFPVTGWNGSAWVSNPNAPADWDGTTNTLKIVSSTEPIAITGVAPGVRYYVRVVAVDTSNNRSAPSAQYDAVAGGAPRAATVIVAASDASPASKAGADYVCDGADDQNEINDALKALSRTEVLTGMATDGGADRIYLDATAGEIDDAYNGLIIEIISGTGAGQARIITDYLYFTNNYIAKVYPNWAIVPNATSVYKISLVSGSVKLTEGKFFISDVVLVPCNALLNGQGSGTILTFPDGFSAAINMLRLYPNGELKDFVLDGNKANCTNAQAGITCPDSKAVIPTKHTSIENIVVKDFRFEGIFISNSASNTTIKGCKITGCDGVGVHLQIDQAAIITDNFIMDNEQEGIYAWWVSNLIISNNHILNNGWDGITLKDALHNQVVNNNIRDNGRAAHNTYCNILLSSTGECDQNVIQGNICRRGTGVNQTKYGIRINDAGCTRNIVTNNDCYESGVTAGISNAGTNTSFGAGNRNNDGTWSTMPN